MDTKKARCLVTLSFVILNECKFTKKWLNATNAMDARGKTLFVQT